MNEQLDSLKSLNQNTVNYFENFNTQQAKPLEFKVEKKLDLEETKTQLNKELIHKMDNLRINLEELTEETHTKILSKLPKEFSAEAEKFTQERTVDMKKPHVELIELGPSYLNEVQSAVLLLLQERTVDMKKPHVELIELGPSYLNEVQSAVLLFEKFGREANIMNNIFEDFERWFSRFLAENSITDRVKELASVDLKKELAEAKKMFENKLQEVTALYSDESKVKEMNKITWEEQIMRIGEIEKKLNTEIEKIRMRFK
eukprot:CAMPEP_0170536292 /NCGR_PEP_ID=MMETSP0209-20121228/102069_1 /TAXON_ID=665100 ORGANISM="Litonotus pictus, Strain P1" /NCGR_SAMPLE_ID=MMETSP0209 /ASSEMBLY_ACC=CAM_ASM_000301 /LENGTH=258 /DNA_ID=CAMNT_0010837641 /DNA_START=69 /DNA_END=844 /DNA_ORIENTATION=-